MNFINNGDDDEVTPPRTDLGGRVYEIWMEGYAVTGDRGTAHMIGEAYGLTFDDAVRAYAKQNPSSLIEYTANDTVSVNGVYIPNNRKDTDWAIWGCGLFDNEADARKAFG